MPKDMLSDIDEDTASQRPMKKRRKTDEEAAETKGQGVEPVAVPSERLEEADEAKLAKLAEAGNHTAHIKSRQDTAATLACSADGISLPIVVSEGGRCRTFVVSGGLADASWFFSGWQQ